MSGDIIIFGLICAGLVAMVLFVLFLPMLRRSAQVADESADLTFYRDQLAEVDRDLARGVLDEGEAERTRTEISRRLLAADAGTRAAAGEAPAGLSKTVAVVVGLAVMAGTGGLYWSMGALGYGDVPRATRIAVGEQRRANRPTQLQAEAMIPEQDAISAAPDETAAILQALRAATFERPDAVQGWAYLAQTEASIGNMQRAARAQERTIALLGAEANADDYIRLVDFLVVGTNGYLSPEAETIAVRVLQMDPDNIPALYYAGLLYAQNDRPDRGFGFWRRVIEEGDPDTLHWGLAADQINDVANQLGIDYVLPAVRGPSAEDLAAAEDMAPEDRADMIQGMVSQLADRLATEGGPPQDWARLVSSLAVLGETDVALRVLGEAELVFGGDVQAVNIVRRAAQDAGLIE